MKPKSKLNDKPQAEINTVLYAVAPQPKLSTDAIALEGAVVSRGNGIGATSKPILFSSLMVTAILQGRKTQTRRIMKVQPKDCYPLHQQTDDVCDWRNEKMKLIPDRTNPNEFYCEFCGNGVTPDGHSVFKSPYGTIGDTLWVRETWWKRPFLTCKDLRDGADTWPEYEYEVEKIMAWDEAELKHYGWKRMPSIFMPREASRIKLTITNIRVEPLNSISEDDALAEGITHHSMNDPKVEYRWLWEKINGRGSWALNPFVWVIEFSPNK